MGWLIAIGILVLLAFIPVGINAEYNSRSALIRLILGPIRFTLFPGRKRGHKRKKSNSTDAVAKDDFESRKTLKKSAAGQLSDYFPLLRLVFEFLSDFRQKLRIDRLEMKLILAGDDPCDLAVNYGRAWAALGNLMPQLERLFVIKKRDLSVACDFTSNETRIDARADLTLTVARLLSLGVYHGIRMLCRYFKIIKQFKAVQ